MHANTVTFVAADGVERSFPLEDLIKRGALLADKVNGEDMIDVLDCRNQLWIPGLPARYYVRDVVSVRFSHADRAPSMPSGFVDDGRDYTNRPNVSVEAPHSCPLGSAIEFRGYASDYDRRIVAVELSLDRGAHWTVCETPQTDVYTCVNWKFSYTPSKCGHYYLQVRAVGEDGARSPRCAEWDFDVPEDMCNAC